MVKNFYTICLYIRNKEETKKQKLAKKKRKEKFHKIELLNSLNLYNKKLKNLILILLNFQYCVTINIFLNYFFI